MLMAIEREYPNMAALEAALTAPEPEEWCMIAMRPGKEPEFCDSFRRYGVRCFWPNYYRFDRQYARRQGRKGSLYGAIIPGYLFTPLPHTVAFHRVIESHEGSMHAVKTFSGNVLALKNAAIEVIRKIEATMNTPKPKASLHNFKLGQKVRFSDDTLSHWPPGIVGRLVDDGRIVVEVEVMGRLVPFQVMAHQIERI